MNDEYIRIKKQDLENIKKHLYKAEKDYFKYRDRYFILREYFIAKGYGDIFLEIERRDRK